jgi:hypothetical protein
MNIIKTDLRNRTMMNGLRTWLCAILRRRFLENLILRKLRGHFSPWKIRRWVYVQSGIDVLGVLGPVCFLIYCLIYHLLTSHYYFYFICRLLMLFYHLMYTWLITLTMEQKFCLRLFHVKGNRVPTSSVAFVYWIIY